jgi:hypothetical protein
LWIGIALACALGVASSPAFATPSITASSGSAVVAPFITPIGSTTSQFAARSVDSILNIPAIGLRVSCVTAILSGYVGATHTQARITSFVFGGNGSGRDCLVVAPDRGSGPVAGDEITCLGTANGSIRPWFLHISSGPDRNASSTATLNIPAAAAANSCTYVFTVPPPIGDCAVSWDNAQSLRAAYTNDRSTLELDAGIVATSRQGPSRTCGITGSVGWALRATYLLKSNTPRTGTPTITAGS